MRRNLGKAIAIGLVLAACGPGPRDPSDTPDGGGGGGGDGGGGGNDDGSITGDGCPDESKLVYTVDQNNKFSQFNPATKSFTDLGTLSCSQTASPFSMAIARDATAWVLYDDGKLYRVETKNSLVCSQAAWVPNTQGLRQYGMGFSTDQVGGTTDTLFIAGGSGPPPMSSTSTLARLDTGTFQPMSLGSMSGWPELTGTGSAELWGFFPGTAPRIAQLNKANGSAIRTFTPAMLAGTPTAWAFAFHGGSFWVFLKKGSEGATTVYQFNSTTGAHIGDTLASGRTIVGAGVSTCAPIIL